MADLKKTIEILFEGNDQASRKAADVLGKIREMEAQARATSIGTGQLEASLERVGKTGPGISAVNTALITLASSLAFKAFVDANVSVERFENGLRAVQGSSVNVTAQLTYVRETANRLGLDVGGAANSFVQLTAATQGTALQGKGTRDIFEAISQAMGALGKSSSETEGAFLAITQIVSKGKVTMEELRGQLGERLPGAMQIAARSMGVTTGEFEALVKSGLSAEQFLPRFAAELNRTFAGATFDGYQASMNRLKNSVDELLVQAGKAGAFDLLTSGVKFAGEVTKQATVETTFWGLAWDATARLFRNGDLTEFGQGIRYAENQATLLSATLDTKMNQSLAETGRLARQAQDALNNKMQPLGMESDQSDAETSRLVRQMNEAEKKAAELDATLKRIGVDPKKTSDAIQRLADDLETLAKNPRSNGELFVQAFTASLKRATTIEDVRVLGEKLATLFAKGEISAEAYAASLKVLEVAFGRVTDSGKKAKDASDDQAKSMAKQAEETRKAEENLQKFRVEMEKLASNERIKNIEAKVKLNIAEIEAQTKRVEAAFESINTTVNSTGDLLGELFGALKDYDNLSFRASNLIEKQIGLENDRRQEALNLQKKLVEAQVAQLQAQTRAVERGDSIIKVDGAGLQPHLEAFMWEILRQIQVRVNADGLKMLLGV